MHRKDPSNTSNGAKRAADVRAARKRVRDARKASRNTRTGRSVKAWKS